MRSTEECVFLLNLLNLCYLTYKYLKEKNKNKRRWWVRPLYRRRIQEGFFEKTFLFIKRHDPDLFFKYTRMKLPQYELLLTLVKPALIKFSQRRPINPECRLALTLV